MTAEPVVLEKKLNSLKIREMTAIENKLNAGPKELIALSLFSGGGGLDLGFSAAGFRVGCSTDIDSFSCQTLILNNGRKIFYNHAHSITADITEISAEYLLRKAELFDREIDIQVLERCVGVARRRLQPDFPTTENLVEVCGKLLPVITKFFGLP